MDNVTWQPFSLDNPSFLRVKLPLEQEYKDFYWSNVSFWLDYAPDLVNRLGKMDVNVTVDRRLVSTDNLQ